MDCAGTLDCAARVDGPEFVAEAALGIVLKLIVAGALAECAAVPVLAGFAPAVPEPAMSVFGIALEGSVWVGRLGAS